MPPELADRKKDMIGIALTAALSAAQVPTLPRLPQELEAVRVEVIVQTTCNHFSAENPSFLEQLLLFASEDLGTFAAVRLGPGGRVVYPFPRGSAKDLSFEVVALDGARWRNTGSLSLSDVQDSARNTVFVQGTVSSSIAWTSTSSSIRHLPGGPTLATRSMLEARPELATFAATHVPTPRPVKDEKEGPPPVLDKKPLPPV